MKFKVFSELTYKVNADTTFLFNIEAANTRVQKVLEEKITTNPIDLKIDRLKLGLGKAKILRLHVKKMDCFKINYSATVETKLEHLSLKNELETPLHAIAANAIPYLFPSRYSQEDMLDNFADKEFGAVQSTYGKVLAICDWIYKKVSYLSGSSNGNTSAIETITQLAGVCRDFAHLAIACCRALSIPARYFAGYAYQLTPPDFHACFEAFIDGKWLFFDATRLVPINGMVKIAHGCDASDTSFANIYGDAEGIGVVVSCEAMDKDAFEEERKNLAVVSYE